jgi:hypothetical protein
VSDSSEVVAVFGDPVAPELARTLDLAGYDWKPITSPDEAAELEPAGGWAGAIIDCTVDSASAWAFARTIRKRDPGTPPVLAVVSGTQLGEPGAAPGPR